MKKSLQILLLSPLLLVSLAACGETSESTPSSSYYGQGLAGALEHAKNNDFGIVGKVYTVYDEDGGEEKEDSAYFDLHNIFSKGALTSQVVYHYTINENTYDQAYDVTYFEGQDGLTYRRGLSLQNQVVDEKVSSSQGGGIIFEDNFDNPFKELSYMSFISLEDGYFLKPKFASFAISLVQQSISVKKVSLKIENDIFSSIDIWTNSSSSLGSVYTSQHYKLTFKWGEQTGAPNITPYETLSEHKKLGDALYALNKKLSKKNFTAHTALSTNNGNAQGSTYYTKEGIYSDAKDQNGATHGYKKVGSSYYSFKATTSDEKNYTIEVDEDESFKESSLYPAYKSFAAELFVPSENGLVYELREDFLAGVTSLVAPALQKDYYAAYASELKITLDTKGNFESITFGYYDYYNDIDGEAIVTYQNFEETELPIDLSANE